MNMLPEAADSDLEMPPQGTADWHALLFTPSSERVGLAAALACRREIAGTVRGPREDLVARVRLGWWREEIALLAEGRPRHPATRHLAGAMTDPARAAGPLSGQVAAAERDLARAAYDDREALLAHAEEDGGGHYELIVRATAGKPPSPEAVAAIRRLGAADRLVGIVRGLHQDVVEERYYLPESLTRELDLSRENIAAAPASDALREALGRVATMARTALADGLSGLPPAERADSVSVLVLSALRARLLRDLERQRFDVIGKWNELGSFAQLTTAWNAARRSLRGRPPKLAGIKP